MSQERHGPYGGACVVMICGDESGVGKTSVCMGILSAALRMGFPPQQLAYIKPCTQCEDVQLLWKWCEAEGIVHQGIGPILYRAGYTQECIDGQHGTAQERLKKVYEAVKQLSVGKILVLVDGVGYPGVGSCVGCSNAQVAERLGIPVVLVGRPGIGNAIDSTVMAIDYFAQHGVKILGALWNRVPRQVSYHTFDRCKAYVTKFFRQEMPNFGVYGHVPVLTDDAGNEQDGAGCKVSCALRKPSKQSLTMTPEDVDKCLRMCKLMLDNVDHVSLLRDVFRHYGLELPSECRDPRYPERLLGESSRDQDQDQGGIKRGSLLDFATPELLKRVKQQQQSKVVGGLIIIPPPQGPNRGETSPDYFTQSDKLTAEELEQLAKSGGMLVIPPGGNAML